MTDWRVIQGKVERFAKHYRGEKFHALLADSPYEYGFMGKSWDATGISYQADMWAALAEHLLPGAFGMTFGGARSWHRIAVAIEDAGLVIHPSIFAWVNGQGFPKATRIDTQVDRRKGGPGLTLKVTQYLNEARKRAELTTAQVCAEFGMATMAGHWFAISEAGQPIIPRLKYWPKLKEMLDLDDRFDDAITAHEREVVSKGQSGKTAIWNDNGGMGNYDITAPATSLAATWEGHRYGLQAIKPAVEPIIVFQKPYEGKPVECITETGAGALWVDGGRVAGGDPANLKRLGRDYTSGDTNFSPMVQQVKAAQVGGSLKGRWPANLVLVHSEGCRRVGTRRVRGNGNWTGEQVSSGAFWGTVKEMREDNNPADPDGKETVAAWECEEGCPARALGEQSGERPTGNLTPDHKRGTNPWVDSQRGGEGGKYTRSWGGDTGTAARFFQQCDWSLDRLEWECVEGCPVRTLGEQSGELKPGHTLGGGKTPIYGSGDGITYLVSKTMDTGTPRGYTDTGTAARFFQQCDWSLDVAEQLAQSDGARYCAKASRRERDAGLEGMPQIPMRYGDGRGNSHEIFNQEGCGRNTDNRPVRNHHPTVKPITLTQYLATLLLPPDAYAPRRILVPFAGSGSEMIGAMLAGWDEIVGVEMIDEYCDIARARLSWWEAMSSQVMFNNPKEILKASRGK